MRTIQVVEELARFDRRGAGTDAERRAALALGRELQSNSRDVRIEPFWCRPNWALAHAWHAGLALAGSLVSVGSARVGGVLILIGLVCVVTDAVFGNSLGRRLTREHASQNVVSSPPEGSDRKRVRVIIAANYDAGRTGVVFRDALRAPTAALARLTGNLAPGWLGWLAVAFIWLLAVSVARQSGSRGSIIGIVQLVPTVGLVLAVALLLDLAGSEYGPAAGDNGTGVAVAIALARALDASPPARADIEVVLGGAADGTGIGLRKHLRARRRELGRANTVVLGIAACSSGEPRWWLSDGSLVPVRYFGALRQLCGNLAKAEPGLGIQPHRGRGFTPAIPARLSGLPAISIGCLDKRGLTPRSHQPGDVAEAVDQEALDRTVEFGMLLVDEVDRFLARADRREAAARA